VIGVLPAYSVRSAWGWPPIASTGRRNGHYLGVIARPEDLERAVEAVAGPGRSSLTCSSTASWRTTRWSTPCGAAREGSPRLISGAECAQRQLMCDDMIAQDQTLSADLVPSEQVVRVNVGRCNILD
jgi:hypothetical protein